MGRKMSFARRNITQYPPSQQRQINSDSPPNFPKIMTHQIRTNIGNIPESYLLYTVTHSTLVSGTKSTSIVTVFKKVAHFWRVIVHRLESSGSSESLDCSSESLVASLSSGSSIC